jgi:hypothetical protein
VRIANAVLAPTVVAVVLTGCSGGRAIPKHPPPSSVPGWRAVLRDWYDDGKFEQRHPCSAVREAMKHLPADGPMYSSVLPDIKRYARRVC